MVGTSPFITPGTSTVFCAFWNVGAYCCDKNWQIYDLVVLTLRSLELLDHPIDLLDDRILSLRIPVDALRRLHLDCVYDVLAMLAMLVRNVFNGSLLIPDVMGNFRLGPCVHNLLRDFEQPR